MVVLIAMIPKPSEELLEYLIGLRLDRSRNSAIPTPVGSAGKSPELSGGVYFANISRAPYLDIDNEVRLVLQQTRTLDSRTADRIGIDRTHLRCCGRYETIPDNSSVIRSPVDALFSIDSNEQAVLISLARWALRIAARLAQNEGLTMVPSVLFFAVLICFDGLSLSVPDPILIYENGNLWQETNYRLNIVRSRLLDLLALSSSSQETQLSQKHLDREKEICTTVSDGEDHDEDLIQDGALASFGAFRTTMIESRDEWMQAHGFVQTTLFNDEYDLDNIIPILKKRGIIIRTFQHNEIQQQGQFQSAVVYARDVPRIKRIISNL